MVTRTRVLHQRNLAAGLALILLLSASTSAAAATLRWIRTYNGAANDTDCSEGVAVARDGSIYVTGYTNVEGQSSNLLLRKYLATGALRWMRTYNVAADSSDSGSGVAIGPDGSVYVTGRTAVAPGEPSRALLLKYSAGGALQWMRSYKGATSSTVDAYGVAVGPDGSVYVTGRTYVDGQCDNLLLLKYSARGVRQWVKTYNDAANGCDDGRGVAVGPDGSVYVTGRTYVVGQSDNLLLLKYSARGVRQWVKTYNGAASSIDDGFGVAVAPDGSVHVAGRTYVDGQNSNLLLLKYSARGVRQWVKTYNGAANGHDFGFGVAAGPDGSVYVTGDTDVDGQNSNLLLLKYSARGVRQWVKTYNGAANGYDFGYGVAAGPDGSVYVTGDTYVVGQSYNLLLLKYK